ncbi:MAG: hypothetical protein V4611_00400 [Patescibacteria group bacterium]
MSETPKLPEESTFFQKAAKFVQEHPVATIALAGTAIVGPPVGRVVSEGIQNANNEANTVMVSQQSEAEHEAFIDALNARYPEDSAITRITIAEGQGLASAALDAIVVESGLKSETQLKPLIISSIKNSAEYYTDTAIVQPGEEFVVVEDESKPVGSNWLLVKPDQIVYPNVTEIPTPIIESTENQ